MKSGTQRNGYLVLGAILIAGTAAVWALSPRGGTVASADAAEVVVYKTPACGCCEAWADHMEEAGFAVRVEDRTDLVALKRDLGVPASLFSCHTAVVDGRVVEGHVPASTVRRYLAAGSPGEGLSVPGMPAGSPGMPSSRPQSYDVFTFDGSSRVSVFESR